MKDINAQMTASMNSLMNEFNVITHNMANASTVGYKRRINSFAETMMAQEAIRDRELNDEGEPIESIFDFSQGSVTETGRSLDMALYGKGFFTIETPEGSLYTRNGMFRTNQNGQLVDSQGRMIAGENGAIVIPPTVSISQVTVSSDGTIREGLNEIGKLKLVDFEDEENKLIPAGMNCFSAPEDVDPKRTVNIAVKQGYLESSNVQIIEELVDMISVSRLYEANMKFATNKKEGSRSLMSVAMG